MIPPTTTSHLSPRENHVFFASHNLATSARSTISCPLRNVMSLNRLAKRVHNFIYESLSMFGIFGLGNKESLKFTPREAFYERLEGRDKLYRKVR